MKIEGQVYEWKECPLSENTTRDSGAASVVLPYLRTNEFTARFHFQVGSEMPRKQR